MLYWHSLRLWLLQRQDLLQQAGSQRLQNIGELSADQAAVVLGASIALEAQLQQQKRLASSLTVVFVSVSVLGYLVTVCLKSLRKGGEGLRETDVVPVKRLTTRRKKAVDGVESPPPIIQWLAVLLLQQRLQSRHDANSV
ncbi:hypothetical protein Efla_006564 [Eimeria flavescens]